VQITRGYRTELNLNNEQITACKKHAGAARWAYNWGLHRKQEVYKATGRNISAMELHKELNKLKQTKQLWLYEVSKCAPQEALRDLDLAFKHFFRRRRLKREGMHKGKTGYPRFKSRKKGLGSFRLTGSIIVQADAIQLPRLGRLRLKERDYLPTCDVHVLSATVAEQAGHWFVSLRVREELADLTPASGKPIGVRDALHKATSLITAKTRRERKQPKKHITIGPQVRRERPKTIVLEDLNIKGMIKNHKLAQAIGDVGMGEFERQVRYKAEWNAETVLQADRFYPSTKKCSRCGSVKAKMALSERVYVCEREECGLVIDRDLNAALNLAALAL
jgi:putative transposase